MLVLVLDVSVVFEDEGDDEDDSRSTMSFLKELGGFPTCVDADNGTGACRESQDGLPPGCEMSVPIPGYFRLKVRAMYITLSTLRTG